MKQVRAVNTEEAFYTLDPLSPVLPTDPWYCPLESYFDPRHFALTPRLNRLFRPPASLGRTNDYVHVAVVGNQGTGKTTQVRKTMLELESSGIQPAFVDARSALDESNFTFADIMLTIAQTVVNDLREAKINIPAAQYELVKNWFSETLLIEDHRQQILGSLETEASAKGGIPFLANMVAKVTATLKSDNEYRKEIRRRADSDLEKLIFDLNLLLDAANAAWTKKKKRDCTVAVVFDNLEKIKNQELINAAILLPAERIRQLRCHLVLFLDPADQFAPITKRVDEAYSMILVPMLHIRDRENPIETVCTEAENAIRDLLDKRIDLAKVFDDPKACVLEIARMSGGRLRDVLGLARRACENALSGKITLEDVKHAARSLRSERATNVKPHQWPRLIEIHRDKAIANDPNDAYLLLQSLALNYNGEQWFDIHPLLTLDERFKTLWTQSQNP